MTEEPGNLVLVYLRRIDAKVDALAQRIDDLTHRMSAVESGFAAVRRDLGIWPRPMPACSPPSTG